MVVLVLGRRDKRVRRQESRYVHSVLRIRVLVHLISHISYHARLPLPTSPNSSAYGAVVYPASSPPSHSPLPVPAHIRGPHPFLSHRASPTLRPFPTRDPSSSRVWHLRALSLGLSTRAPRPPSHVPHKPQTSHLAVTQAAHPDNCYIPSSH